MATPQGAQPPPPPTAYDRDDHLIGVLAGALRAQTDAVVERLDGVTTELRSTRDALVADSRAGRRIAHSATTRLITQADPMSTS